MGSWTLFRIQGVLAYLGCRTECQRLGGFDNRTLFSQSEAGSLRLGGQRGQGLVRSLFLVCGLLTVSLHG